MLNMLDIAIGFATVMLAVSLIVMSLTQALAGLLALRGAKLRLGLEMLISNAVPELKDKAASLSEKILKHPLVCDSATRLGGRWAMATAIKREELIPVLKAVLAESRLQELTAAQQERVELWFESFMARVSQWFVMNTRWITVGFAVIIAFVMHLDTGRVLQQIQTDSELRARLSAMSASLLDQTPEAIKQVQDEYFAVLKELVAANGTRFAAGATPDAASITTRDQAKDWIVKNAAPPEAAAELTRTYETTLSDRMSTALNKSIDRALTIRGQLTSAGFSVVPAGHRPTDSLDPTRAEFWGIVASVLFLSLGAPFWFNVLKNMTSLKSIVAQKDASASEAKPPAAQAPARAPAAATRSLERSAGETLPAGQPPPDRLPDLPSARRA